MIKIYKKFCILALFTISSLFFAHSAQAQSAEYHLLAPIPQLTKDGGDTTDTATYIPGLFKLAIALAGVLAVIRIIYAGIIYMTTDAFTGKSSAKSKIWDAIWGLLLAIGAWTILNTINPKILNFDLNISNEGSSGALVSPGITGPNYNVITTGTSGAATGVNINNPNGLTQADAYNQLTSAHVGFQGAPLLAGIQQVVVDEVVSLKNSCGCDVVVNSATGGNHADGTYSHANGWKVDLDDTTSLNNYISQNFTNTHQVRSSDGAVKWLSPTGVAYYRESTHWDVTLAP